MHSVLLIVSILFTLSILAYLRSARVVRSGGIYTSGISILIPLYNDELYVEDCLLSILAQSFKTFEVIVVDDCSTDRSGLIAELFSKRDNRIKVFHHSRNRGSLLARKTAVEHATNDYCVFVDADDFLPSSSSLEEMMRLTDTKADIIQFSITTFGNVSRTEKNNMLRWFKPFRHSIKGAYNIIDRCFARSSYCWNLCGKVYRTEICKIGFSNVRETYSIMAEDAYCFFLIAVHANTYRGIRTNPLYAYRYGSGISNGREMTLQRFFLHTSGECMMHNLIQDFLKSIGEEVKYRKILKQLRRRILDDAQNRLQQLGQRDRFERVPLVKECFKRDETY